MISKVIETTILGAHIKTNGQAKILTQEVLEEINRALRIYAIYDPVYDETYVLASDDKDKALDTVARAAYAERGYAIDDMMADLDVILDIPLNEVGVLS